MNVESIRQRLHESFTPFAIRLTDGRKYLVPHTDSIAVSKHAVVVMDNDGFPVNVDPLNIVSLDDLPATAQN